jgi:hypothetical protein
VLLGGSDTIKNVFLAVIGGGAMDFEKLKDESLCIFMKAFAVRWRSIDCRANGVASLAIQPSNMLIGFAGKWNDGDCDLRRLIGCADRLGKSASPCAQQDYFA